MKKIISLALVLCLVFALAPAAYASNPDDSAAAPDISYQKFYEDLFLFVHGIVYDAENEGILQGNGHLMSCNGGDCQCYAVVSAAHDEYRQQKWEQSLQVWIRSSRDDDDQRHDTVVAELERPYKAKKVTENEEYLEGKSAVVEKLKELVDEDELAEQDRKSVV